MQSDTPICRVCRCEGSEEQPLFYPCHCSGSIKYIHQDCLVEWLNHSKKKYCELCKYPFTFSPIYAPQMPSTIPFSVLAWGSIKFAAKFIRRSLRILFAVFLWSFLVPVVSAQIFRYYFGFSLQGLLELTPLRLMVEFSSPEELQQYVFESTVYLLFDVVQGLLICAFTVFLGLGLLLTREFQSMVRAPPDLQQNRQDASSDTEEPASPIINESVSAANVGIRFRSSAIRNATVEAATLTDPATQATPPQSPQMDESTPRSPRIFSPQAQQLFTEIARLEEALNGTGSASEASSSTNPSSSSGYWLDRVHPKEYKKYVQRSNLQRQMMPSDTGNNGTAADNSVISTEDPFSFWSSPNFDDHLSNISGTTTLRTNATTRTNSNLESIRCRICSSTTCINRDHVIQASRMRFASVAARNQALIDEAIEFGGFNTQTNQASQSGPNPTAANPTVQPTRPTRIQPPPPQQQEQADEEWRINLDADSITLAEFFGFSAEGSNPVELLQNAAIVAGCNALVMILFLCIPSLFGSIVLKEASLWNSLLTVPSASKASGFAARLLVGYSILAVLLSFYHSLGKRFFRDAFHRSFLPVLAFFGTFCKLVTLMGMEIVAFPIACGFLVDFLTLPLFPGSSWLSRLKHFHLLPVSSLAIHWALGAVFMLSFANHVSFLRSFCRPGLIYFLRNPSDPDAHPLREMLERGFTNQLYRLLVSFAFYGVLMAGSVGASAQIVSFLPIAPLKFSFSEPLAEAPLGLLLHLSFRWLLARLQPGQLLGRIYQSLAGSIIASLGLSSYFLGKHDSQVHDSSTLVAVPDFDRIYSRAAMKAIRQFRPTSLNQTDKPPQSTIVYRPKSFFALRCLAVIAAGFLACQAFLTSALVVPLCLGRFLFPGVENELFTLFLGAVPIVLLLGLLGGQVKSVVSRESVQKAATLVLTFFFAGIVWPLMLGILFVLITVPLLNAQVLLDDAKADPLKAFLALQADPLSQSIPVVFFTTCWSIGFPLLKIGHLLRDHLPLPAMTRAALENPSQTLNPFAFLAKIALPITLSLLAFLLLPPLLPILLVPLFTSDASFTSLIIPAQRLSHLGLLVTWLSWRIGCSLGNSLGAALANIRDDAYLIGRQLHNLERNDDASTATAPETPTLRERRIPTTPIL